MGGSIITLTTDFGLRDHYVGAVKGAILSINPEAILVDISHDITPQDVAAAAFALAEGASAFPTGTVHLAVVDPGVGTRRRALAVEVGGHTYVAPDNGLLSYVLASAGVPLPAEAAGPPPEGSLGLGRARLSSDVRAYELTQQRFWRRPVSTTFHGRDVFAPVAAHLSLGVPAAEMGEQLDSLQAFVLPPVSRGPGGSVVGSVIYVDRFGNLVTNIRMEELPPGADAIEVEIAGRRLQGLAASYAEGGELLCLIGSSGRLEVAARSASAAARLGVGLGTAVRVRPARR